MASRCGFNRQNNKARLPTKRPKKSGNPFPIAILSGSRGYFNFFFLVSRSFPVVDYYPCISYFWFELVQENQWVAVSLIPLFLPFVRTGVFRSVSGVCRGVLLLFRFFQRIQLIQLIHQVNIVGRSIGRWLAICYE